MNNLTKRMFDEWLPYIKENRKEEWKKNRYEEIHEMGEVVRIEDEFYPPPYDNQISKRRYTYANGYSRVLEDVRATGEPNGLPFEPIKIN